MNKVLLIVAVAGTLAGCTPREQQLVAAGAVGAVAGAVIASEATRPQPVYVEERRPIVLPPRAYMPPPRRCYSVWDRTPYGLVERRVCN
jgi:hypothetical protein